MKPQIRERDGVLHVDIPPRLGARRAITALLLAVLGVLLLQRGAILDLIVGPLAVAAAFWIALRREFIEATPGYISLGTKLGPLGNGREYAASEVRNLRVWPAPTKKTSTKPPLAFEHGERTIRFGAGLSHTDAVAVLNKMLAATPEAGRSRSVLGLEEAAN